MIKPVLKTVKELIYIYWYIHIPVSRQWIIQNNIKSGTKITQKYGILQNICKQLQFLVTEKWTLKTCILMHTEKQKNKWTDIKLCILTLILFNTHVVDAVTWIWVL